MFDRLSDGFNSVFKKLSGKGAITEANVREAMDDVRTDVYKRQGEALGLGHVG